MKLTRTIKENICAVLWKRNYRNVRFLANGDVVGRYNGGLADETLIANTHVMSDCERLELAPFIVEVINVESGGVYKYLPAFTKTEEKEVFEKAKAQYNDLKIWNIVRYNAMTGFSIKLVATR